MAAKKQYTAFQWKCFMAFLMVLDHLPYIPGLVPPTVTGIFHVLTRCVGVWFAYLAVEGFLHTKSRVRYMARLFVWAGIMALGNALYNTIGASRGLHLSNNIFLTLALGVLMLNILVGSNPATQWGVRPRSAGEWTLRLFGVILVLAASLFSEGGILILPFLLITYLCRERMVLRNVLYFALSAVLFLLVFVPYPTAQETLQMLAFNSDFLFITVLPVLSHYDGTRGPNTKGSKYFFYVFYPLHLWVIGILAFWLA